MASLVSDREPIADLNPAARVCGSEGRGRSRHNDRLLDVDRLFAELSQLPPTPSFATTVNGVIARSPNLPAIRNGGDASAARVPR